MRANARAIAVAVAAVVAAMACVALPAPASAANFSVGQNADMLLGATSFTDRSWSPVSNVVALWRFDADTGQTADATGNGHTLTAFNGPGTPGGPTTAFHEALGVNGTTQYMSATSSVPFDLTTNFSIEAWFRTSDISLNPWPTIVGRQKTSGNFDTNYELFFDRSANAIGFAFTKSGGTVWSWVTTSAVPYTNGNWHHVVGTYDGADARLYLDGVQQASAPFTGAVDTPNVPITIGQTYPTSTDFFKGDIDDVRLSSIARPAAEILADYTAQLPHRQHGAERGMVRPASIAFDTSGSTYVADRYMNRLTRWNSTPIANGQALDLELFSPTFANGSTPNVRWSWFHGLPANGLNRPVSVSVAGDGATLKVAVADRESSRVVLMARDESLLADGDTGTVALGQPNMTTASIGISASSMNFPEDVWTDGTKVAVADKNNNRVLLWDSWPTTGQAADHVLGQTGFTTADNSLVCSNRAWSGTACYGSGSAQSNAATAANTLDSPMGVHFDGTRLYVADTGSNRVLVWTSWPASNGLAADYVIGQVSFNAVASSAAIKGLDGPVGVSTTGAGAGHRIAIASRDDNRVTVYNAWPSAMANTPDASAVLGQSGHSLSAPNRGAAGTGRAAANTLSGPHDLSFDPSGKLWIADSDNNRVVRYSTLTTGSSADRVLGHAGTTEFTSSTPLDAPSTNWFPTITLPYMAWSPPDTSRIAVAPSGKLVVSDSVDHSVRLWNTAPAANETAYDVRWGQPLRSDSGPNGPSGVASAAVASEPGQVWTDGTRMLVADTGNNRVLAWTSLPATDTTPANYVIGQSAFGNVGSGTGLNQFDEPGGVTSDGTDVYVADTDNHRVLIFRNFWATAANGKTADAQLGTGTAAASATTLDYPWSIDVSQGQLVVGEHGNRRISVWNNAQSLVTGSPIDAIVGQANATSKSSNTITNSVAEVSAAGGSLFWATTNSAATTGDGIYTRDPIPTSGFVTTASGTIGTPAASYYAAPGTAQTMLTTGVSARAGRVWATSQGFGRVMRWTDVTAPTISTQPTATVRCDGTVTISWGTSESTTMEVRYDTVSRASWGAGYVSSTTDLFGGVARYAGLTHTTDLSIPTPGTYYARVQGQDWAGTATPASNEISFVVPATCAPPTTMFGDDSNAQAGTGRANPSSSNTPIKSTTFHTSWQNVAGVTMDRYQGQTWTTPPEQAGGVWHLNSSLAGDANGTFSGAGSWTGTATYVTGKFGNAVSTTSGRYVTIPHDAAISKANDFSVDLWFRTPSIANSGYPIIATKSATGCGDGSHCNYSIEFDRAANQFCAALTRSSDLAERLVCRTAVGLVDNQWHHAAMTLTSGNQLSLYVDGVLAAGPLAVGSPAEANAGALLLGSAIGGADPFAGDIDELRFTPTALSAAAILGYYRTQRPHLQLLHDTGTGGGMGQALGADCATATRCADLTYGTPGAGTNDIVRAGARYYARTRLHTKTNDYWTTWSNDWLETDIVTTLSISVGATINLGTPTSGQDSFGSSTILIDSNNATGYQLLGHDASNTVGMTGTPSGSLPDMQSYLSAPVAWAANNPLGIGYTVRSATGNRLAKWGAAGPFSENDVTNNLYTGLGAVDLLLHQRTTYSAATDTIVLTTRLDAPLNQVAAAYTTTVQLTAVANP